MYISFYSNKNGEKSSFLGLLAGIAREKSNVLLIYPTPQRPLRFYRNSESPYVVARRSALPNALVEAKLRFICFSSVHQRITFLALLMLVCVHFYPLAAVAQNPGTAPVFNKAVQGQTAAQPEGTLLNVVNWIGNVVAPLLAVGAVVMAVISYTQGRGVMRWAVAAVGLLMISGLTRLIESWINAGGAGV